MIPSVQQMTGLNPLRVAPDPVTMPSIGRAAGPGATDTAKPFHPDSPLFWFGLIAATTLGLIAVSTSVRVGPLRGSVSAGTS